MSYGMPYVLCRMGAYSEGKVLVSGLRKVRRYREENVLGEKGV